MIKFYYFTQYDILRARTNQIGDMRFCEGFKDNNCDVSIFVPYIYRKTNIKLNDIFESYGIKSKFKIKILPTILFESTKDYLKFMAMSFWNFVFFIPILLNHIIHRKEPVIIASRNGSILIPFIWVKRIIGRGFLKNFIIVYWIHEIIPSKKQIWIYRNADKIIATNTAILEDLSQYNNKKYPPEAAILNPITTVQLENIISREEAREKLNLNINKPLIVYTGKFYINQEETEYILRAAKQLPQYLFLFTGGRKHVIEHYTKWIKDNNINNVIFTGFIHNYNDIRYYQFAADVLVSYYTNKDHFVRYNLPNKVCEYMLTRNPMIIPNYPATADILNENNAVFVEPENLYSLVEGIKKAVEDKEYAEKIAEQAFKDVQELTFNKRVALLLRYILN